MGTRAPNTNAQLPHSLSVTVQFRYKGKHVQKPIQGRPFSVELRVRNTSNVAFPGAEVGSLEFSGAQRFGVVVSVNFQHSIGRLNPGDEITVSSAEFATYYFDHCAVETKLSAVDQIPINIFVSGPLYTDQAQKGSNVVFVACYVISEDSIERKWSNRLNYGLATLSILVALVSLKISNDATKSAAQDSTSNQEIATKLINQLNTMSERTLSIESAAGTLKSIESHAAKLESIPLKLDAFSKALLKSQQKEKKDVDR